MKLAVAGRRLPYLYVARDASRRQEELKTGKTRQRDGSRQDDLASSDINAASLASSSGVSGAGMLSPPRERRRICSHSARPPPSSSSGASSHNSMVCQNQSIDDSDAPLARDLRLLVRERIAAGDSNSQVLDFLVARYGEFVLLKPRFERQTMLLWLLAPLLLICGGLALWLQIRRRSRNGADVPVPPLTPEEETRLARLMSEEPRSS